MLPAFYNCVYEKREAFMDKIKRDQYNLKELKPLTYQFIKLSTNAIKVGTLLAT